MSNRALTSIVFAMFLASALLKDVRTHNAPMAALMGFALGVHGTVEYGSYLIRKRKREWEAKRDSQS